MPDGDEPTAGAASGVGGAFGLGSSAISEAFAFAAGFALSRVLEPVGTKLRQTAWGAPDAQIRALDPGTAAQIAAQARELEAWARNEARQHGVDADRFDHLVTEARTAPGFADLLKMRNRQTISADKMQEGFRKHAVQPKWDEALADLRHDRLDAAEVARAIQRGVMGNPGILPVGPPTGRGEVEPMPVSPLDPLDEARDQGYSKERLAVMARIVGLPPAPGELLELLNRGHIKEVDYFRGIAEGNTRNEWGEVLLKLRRQLLTPHQYAELHLRGWITTEQMRDGLALHGLTERDADRLFLTLGRPLSVRDVLIGTRRGGDFGGDYSDVPEPYRTAIRQSAIRPEWARIAYARRHSLPSAFVVRNLLRQGTITPDRAEQIFLASGWPADLAKMVAHAPQTQGAASAKALTAENLQAEYEGHFITRDQFVARLKRLGYAQGEAEDYAELGDARRVVAARSSRVARIKAQYVGRRITRPAALKALTATKIPSKARALLMDEWDAEYEVTVAVLTPAQIKKAYKDGIYSLMEALELLSERGYTWDDAATLLGVAEPPPPLVR